MRKGSPSEADLRLFNEYRLSFGDEYDAVIRTIRENLLLEPTGRPSKSTNSIAEKLRRESIRLSQIQDIAGCRIIVPDVLTQDHATAILRDTFPESRVMDRRKNPSYGHRAVHVIVMIQGVSVEIQVRTALQDLWAELSEKLSDVVDSSIKYGGGDPEDQQWLLSISESIEGWEEFETQLHHDDQAFQTIVASEKSNLVEIIQNRISTLEDKRKR